MFKKNWFLISMGVAILLAWLFPSPGAKGGWLYPELLTKVSVALVFFLHGAALSFSALKEGALKWRVHLVVQMSVFLAFPIVGLAIYVATAGRLADELRLGLFYLCALPSTVSSSVAMTAAAKGNVPIAVFNATLSSLIGIILTPLWLQIVTAGTTASFSLGGVVIDLVLWLLLPLIAGQVSRVWIAQWAARNKKSIGLVDRFSILILIYTSFCDSFMQGTWSNNGIGAVLFCLIVSFVLFFTFLYGVGKVADWLGFDRGERIATVFSGSKKSMATGVPMAHLMFGANSGLGMILLPILVYHSLQLILCGILAERWGSNAPSALAIDAESV